MNPQDNPQQSAQSPTLPYEPPSLRRGLDAARKALDAAGVPDARLESEVLLRFVLGWERSRFLAEVYAGGAPLAPDMRERLRSLLARRIAGEPLAYIVGAREFYGLNLRVDERVLIPRQETELLVDLSLDKIAASPAARPVVLDVGTGSGAIALAIAANSPAARVFAADVSAAALAVAKRNAKALGLADRVSFIRCDTLAAARGPVDLIVSNPPYIPSADMANLQPEIRREPRLALDGGADGLDPFRRLARGAARVLAPGGALIAELTPQQMDAAESIAQALIPNARRISRRQDLFGDDRALVAETDGGGGA